jgi:hypothetical protein
MTRLLQRETRLGLTQPRIETAGRQRFSLSETIEWSLRRLPPEARVVVELATIRQVWNCAGIGKNLT